MPIPPGGP